MTLPTTLTILAADPVQTGAYSLGITTACGTVCMCTAIVEVYCPSDLDDGSYTGTPDGGVDINELLFFLVTFEAGSSSADLDDGSFTGLPDGGVDVDELLFFLSHFEVGC